MAADYGYIDDVIEPRETRPRLIRALEMLRNKVVHNPPEEARQHPAVTAGRGKMEDGRAGAANC
ncbi:MAG: hypothetical protein KatS3mg043_1642 [Rhodothermaceae bacterium]|nr:MAG: hypothetical protein KatS3mg043_1642 [Rhodothermaceae bacterium]